MSKKPEVLHAEWFARPALDVASDLLSCRLCRRQGNTVIKWQITETEAYDGPHDRASHARAGETPRTSVMFGPAGIWYVYLCYGIHSLLNIVTGPPGYPAAILIRGAGEIHGPGRLTKALSISGAMNRRPAQPESGLWIETGEPVHPEKIVATSRVGVAYAGEDWSQRPYRFVPKHRVKHAK
jgi:DNA-3-methyladenine glycosylase